MKFEDENKKYEEENLLNFFSFFVMSTIESFDKFIFI